MQLFAGDRSENKIFIFALIFAFYRPFSLGIVLLEDSADLSFRGIASRF
jgi:hypothetical protein